jgi:hypothetical protein
MPTGRELNERWGVGAKHALYRESGDWYHVLKRFPAALFDANGYVRFETRTDLEIPEIRVSNRKGKDWLSVPRGIATLTSYIKGIEVPEHPLGRSEGAPLREYDESERLAVQQSGTVRYRRRHNTMTKVFGQMFGALNPEQGKSRTACTTFF